MTKIILNGTEMVLDRASGSFMSYEDIVTLTGRTGFPTVTFRDRKNDRAGSIHTGQYLTLSDGMIVNVIHTGNA